MVGKFVGTDFTVTGLPGIHIALPHVALTHIALTN
jgi:hypothetical protein